MISKEQIINELLSIEHRNTALKLKLIEGEPLVVSQKLLYSCITFFNDLSFERDPESQKKLVLLSSILWTYRDPSWDGLKDFLIKVLSRSGFAPSSIMLDKDFDKEHGVFSQLSSYIDQIAVASYHLKNEIFVNQKKYLLTQFQYNVWKKIDENKVLGISAPTSAGKSFIIALKTIDLLVNKSGVVVYIVPTISLVNQVSVDYRNLLKEHNLMDYEILNTYVNSEAINRNKKI